jgi:hypothetical protein
MARAIDTSGNVASASAAVTVSNPASDTTAPAVALTAPAPGAVVSGTVSVAGTAADNAAVAKVEVAIDGGPYQPASGTTNWSWSWNTAGATNANHVVTARSTDTSGNVGSSAMSVSVSNPAIGQHWVSPEGIVIDVNTAGPWTVNQIYSMLLQSGRDLDKVGPTLTIKVQDVYASSTAMAVGTADGRYTSASSTIYLKGVNSNFAANPDAVLAHEYGHAWSLYHLYLSQQGDWTSYLQARGIASDPRLDSTYNWDRREIIADDYRLLFGSAPAVSEMPNHLNPDLADPRNVPGLRDFLATAWSTPKP